MLDEKVYRHIVSQTFEQVERLFAEVDPDLVECTVSQGALTLLLASGARCILSAQPSVRQLWMAVAAKGVAYHFNWDEARAQWWDDKGQGIEFWAYLKAYIWDAARVEL